jgi:hypothetical protein
MCVQALVAHLARKNAAASTPPHPDEQVVARFDCSSSGSSIPYWPAFVQRFKSALHRQAVGEQFRKLLEQSPTRHHQYVVSL